MRQRDEHVAHVTAESRKTVLAKLFSFVITRAYLKRSLANTVH